MTEQEDIRGTHDVVVLAAHGVGRAGVAANADSRETGALEANLAGDAANIDTDETEKHGDGALVGLKHKIKASIINTTLAFERDIVPHGPSCSTGPRRCCRNRGGGG